MERPVRDVATLRDSFANVVLESWYFVRKLYSNTRNELASIANVSTAPREEEAGPETVLFKASTGDSARNRGLSSAGQTVQPEDEVLVLPISPVVYLLKQVDASAREASGFLLPLI
jgi:hypothetical protein